MKRTIDIVVSLCALLLLAAPLALMALAIWIEDRKSPLFLGRRVGPQGEFRMVKLRTMWPGAWKVGVNSTASSDPRITKLGRVLRRLKLDEIPQLWNVLMGQMSLVGPRPQVPAETLLYTAEERETLRIRPGITDLASIVFADEGEILAGSPDPDLLYNQLIRPWKSRLALAYIEHASLAVDVKIIALTLVGLVSRRRALRAVAGILEAWNSDSLLVRVALREEVLVRWPPPGANQVFSYSARTQTQ